jgi:hypothetical protein
MRNGLTAVEMMQGGKSAAMAPIPTQTFAAQNILGTAVPQVGDNKGRPNYAAAAGGMSTKTVVIVAVGFMAVGYLFYHLNFEK